MSNRRIRKTAAALLTLLIFAAGCGGKDTSPSAAPSGAAEHQANVSGGGPASAAVADIPVPAVSPDSSASGDSASPAPVAPSPRKQTPGTPSPHKQTSGNKAPGKQKPGEPSPDKQAVRSATLSVAGNAEWGTVVAAENVPLKENDTVADVLIRTLKAHKLAFDTKGSGAMFYVEGIDGLYEFDDGPASGWKYRVNGEVLNVGAGSCKLKPGDRVEWFYTTSDKHAEEAAKEPKP